MSDKKTQFLTWPEYKEAAENIDPLTRCCKCGRVRRVVRPAGEPMYSEAQLRAAHPYERPWVHQGYYTTEMVEWTPPEFDIEKNQVILGTNPGILCQECEEGREGADACAAPASGRSRARRPERMNGSSSSVRRAPQQRFAPLRRPDDLEPDEEHTS